MTDALTQLNSADLAELEKSLSREYALVAANKLSLNLSRGKPAADQLDLSRPLDSVINDDYRAEDGSDVRNYGGIRGLPEAQALGAQLLEVPTESVIAGGNSSLALMHLTVQTALLQGLWGDERNWSRATAAGEKVKILTPVPGYDRHFALSEALGIEMVNIDINADGPHMEAALALAQDDASIKAIWCVPKYSNPTGCIYSPEVVHALAQLPKLAAADDFIVLYDNAYALHDLEFPTSPLEPIYQHADKLGTLNHVVQFASTSKITFAGAGIGFLSSGADVLNALEHQMSVMTIGPDKVNQLRHSRFLKGRLAEHMQAHAELLKPKFQLVQKTLQEELANLDIATWTDPSGGYFVSLDVLPGLAGEVIRLAREVGLTLTPAGATFPLGQDPSDRNVRIAPTYAALEDLRPAMQILTLCVKLASVRKLLTQQ